MSSKLDKLVALDNDNGLPGKAGRALAEPLAMAALAAGALAGTLAMAALAAGALARPLALAAVVALMVAAAPVPMSAPLAPLPLP